MTMEDTNEPEYTPRFCPQGHLKVKRIDKSGFTCPICKRASSRARNAEKKIKHSLGTWVPAEQWKAMKREQNKDA